MYQTAIYIPRKLSNQLLTHAQQSPNKEVCGLVSSINNKAVRCYPIDNNAAQAHEQFLLDSQQHIEAMKLMRERGETLFAIYHSHPNAPAIPSKKDLSLTAYDNVLHFIISLNTHGVLEMRGFCFQPRGAVEIGLLLCETELA